MSESPRSSRVLQVLDRWSSVAARAIAIGGALVVATGWLDRTFTSMVITRVKPLTRVQTGEIRMHRVDYPDLTFGDPPGSKSPRGITDGRVDFTESFSSVPKVFVALKMVDASETTNIRIELSITAVDQRGFNYQFCTWDNTYIYQAAASWIAVAGTSTEDVPLYRDPRRSGCP